jgi:hypothetical protein
MAFSGPPGSGQGFSELPAANTVASQPGQSNRAPAEILWFAMKSLQSKPHEHVVFIDILLSWKPGAPQSYPHNTAVVFSHRAVRIFPPRGRQERASFAVLRGKARTPRMSAVCVQRTLRFLSTMPTMMRMKPARRMR